MKRSTTLFATILIVIFSWQCGGPNPDLMSEHPRVIPHADQAPVIDGKEEGDSCWEDPEWYPISHVWVGEEPEIMDFAGKYALSWNEDRLFLLVKVLDDTLVDTHEDGLVDYWNDDCVEIFIDPDRSGGKHQYNHNAFAYHVALDHKVVDYGTNEQPQYFDHVKSAKTQLKNVTIWEFEIAFYPEDFSEGNQPMKLESSQDIGFAVAYCDADESGERESFMGSEPIEAADKNIAWINADVFGHFRLVKK